ncbi:three-prime repair exonuclease 1 [Plakobranchus ocellatus]|uniref:Three-prime repair exonuclease 1 n=1 Tax=Plakobranchus ocellatus TaxID=259542 RepID=A0AAV3ZAS2_9GAST|nr:three-prime repair exonuclease 1 [Plakobranchus ocellatus]
MATAGASSQNQIKCFVFMDLGTTGLPDKKKTPRITEMGFIALTRTDLKRGSLPGPPKKLLLRINPRARSEFGGDDDNEGIADDQENDDDAGNVIDDDDEGHAATAAAADDVVKVLMIRMLKLSRNRIEVRLSNGLHCLKIIMWNLRQVFPGFHRDFVKQVGIFEQQTIYNFLKDLPRPICIVAHNGKRFDFPLFLANLRQWLRNHLHDVLCADSLEAFKEFERQALLPGKISYALDNIYTRVFGEPPRGPHTAEQDCHKIITIIRAMDFDSFPQWCDKNSVPLLSIKPMYQFQLSWKYYSNTHTINCILFVNLSVGKIQLDLKAK